MTIRQAIAGFLFSPVENWFPIQEIVMKLTGGPKLTTVPVFGARMRYFTSEKLFWQRENFEKHERLLIESMLAPDSILYDIGAHIGFYEIALAPRCERIYAFEPAPANFRRLEEHLRMNAVENVVAVNAAVSDRSGALHLAENGAMSRVDGSGTIEIRAVSIDEFTRTAPPPALVKIDVEGHASRVLAGMTGTLGRIRPRLFIELHDECEEKRTIALLAAHGYAVRLSGQSYPRLAVALP